MRKAAVVDHLSIGLTHLLMALAIWRLLARDDLDRDPDAPVDAMPDEGFVERRLRPRAGKRADSRKARRDA